MLSLEQILNPLEGSYPGGKWPDGQTESKSHGGMESRPACMLSGGNSSPSIYDIPPFEAQFPLAPKALADKRTCKRTKRKVVKKSPARKFPYRGFEEHRWLGYSMEIKVRWADGDWTWEPECNLHEDALESLLAYWKNYGGRPSNPKDPDMYDIFAIRGHSKCREKLLVEWVGYGANEWSWVDCSTIRQKAAVTMVKQYFKGVGSRR